MPYSDLGAYRFVSMNANRKVGSIYYENGRMRLVHGHGPTVSLHIGVYVVYFLKPKDVNFDRNFFYGHIYGKNIIDTCKTIFRAAGASKILKIYLPFPVQRLLFAQGLSGHFTDLGQYGFEYSLYEVFFTNGNATGYHPSRGVPYYIDFGVYGTPFSDTIYNHALRNTLNNRSLNNPFWNFGVYGGFYGYFANTPPFSIYNPYRLHEEV